MRAVKIPADTEQPIHLVEVEKDWQQLAAAIGGPCHYIERFKCPLTPVHGLVGVLDEDGQFNGQPDNPRAWELYPLQGYVLKGDVLVMAERLDPLEGADFVDLPDPGVALSLVTSLLEGARHA